MNHRHVAQRHKTALCLELFLLEKKQEIWCLKRKSLNINLLFIELLHKIKITFVIMLTFGEKMALFALLLTIYEMIYRKYRLYIFCPHILNYVIILNVF